MGQDTGSPAAAEALKLDGLRFAIEKSLRYHQRRRAHFERWHRLAMFCIILMGSAAIVPWSPWFFGLIAAALAALDLVYSPAVRACDHDRLYRCFAELAGSIASEAAPTDAHLRAWAGQRIKIEADEPPVFWAVEADCYNEVARAWGRTKEPLNQLALWQRPIKHFVRFEGTDFAASAR
ncbi:MAG TPA: hypothetical protein PKA13_21555 [Geminicoccaceae bacterium]|nr:hypothetical protein [Geminicoccus sp.]HMU52381.1 hypothetical protein [Geminicoccaceae bacterium]